VCGKEIPDYGFGYHSHMKKHVREGTAVQYDEKKYYYVTRYKKALKY
jgi:hypothetical protein